MPPTHHKADQPPTQGSSGSCVGGQSPVCVGLWLRLCEPPPSPSKQSPPLPGILGKQGPPPETQGCPLSGHSLNTRSPRKEIPDQWEWLSIGNVQRLILKEKEIPDYLTCLLRNLYAGQEATVRTGHGTTDWFQTRKKYVKAVYLSPCLFNLYAEYIMRNAGLDEAQAGIKVARRNINNLRYADDTTLMAESKELKSLLMKVKEESEKVGLKLNIQKAKMMASGPITSWEIDGETVETVSDFIFGGSKITADSDYSHEIRRRLLLGRKVITNLDSILKSRDITLSTKVCLVKAMVSPVVMYGCESWTIKKAERQ